MGRHGVTYVASHAFLGKHSRQHAARLTASTVCITFVTLGELTKWTEIRSWGPRRRESLARWLDRVLLLDFDGWVPVMWGGIQARAQLRGRPRPVNDSWIAACCLVARVPLATFNTKDYADFVQHDGLQLLDLS